MDRHSDLPLFRWTPPPVEVIPFPTTKRVGKIRRTAQQLYESTQRGAEAYWRRTVTDLRRQMERAGIAEDRIERELRAFFDAVQGELNRRACQAVRRQPEGGDAA